MIGKILFTGTLTTVSPFANSPKGCKHEVSGAALLPCLPVGGVLRPAIMPSVLRAALRQAATAEVIEKLGGRVSFADFALYAVGGVKGSKIEDAEKVGVIARSEYARRQHLVGLFGAGESPAGFARGAWEIGAAVANLGDTVVVEGSRRPLNEDPRLVEVLDATELARAKDFGDINRARSRAADELNVAKRDLRKARGTAGPERDRLQARVDELERALAEFKAAGQNLLSDVTIGMPLAGYEVIGSEVAMSHRMAIEMSGNVDRLGLALAALERFGIEPTLGAHQAQGNGRIRAAWEVSHRTVAGRKVTNTPLGRVSIDPDQGCRIEGEPLLAALRHWDEHSIDKALYSAAFDVQSLLAT